MVIFQILHTGAYRWVLVSNISFQPASDLYDSLYNGRVNSTTRKQIASLLFEEFAFITINHVEGKITKI